MAFSIEEIDNEFLARAGQFRVALDQRAFGLLLRVVSTRADTRVLKGTKIANAALDFGLPEEARMRLVLLIILLLLVLGALPTWPYSAEWGFYPSSGLGLVLVVVLILVLMGRV